MEKVARGPVPTASAPVVPEEFLTKVDASVSIEELKHLWEDSVKAGFSDQVSKLIKDKRKALSDG
jgi:hypothetical protein